jgi:hypothetical protein
MELYNKDNLNDIINIEEDSIFKVILTIFGTTKPV